MAYITPVCQLLGRHTPLACADYLWVAPPLDEGLTGHTGVSLWTTDHGHAVHYRKAGVSVHEGLAPPEDLSEVPGVLLFWPKSHALGEWWLMRLCALLPAGTPLSIVGEHQGGIKRVPKVLEAQGMSCQRDDNARRCSLFSTHTVPLDVAPDAGWSSFDALEITLATHPGVFGHGKLDEGTALLLAHLPAKLKGNVLDVGCGGGIISVALAKRGLSVTAIDVEHTALEATRRSLQLNGVEGEVMASDMLDEVSGRFNTIISNPPFHQARNVDIGPARRLMTQAPEHLKREGVMYIVANAFLPYREPLEQTFLQVEEVVATPRFKVYRAAMPRRFAR